MPGLAGLLGLAVAVVIIAALSVAREVLIPITLAVLLSFMLGPVVALLRRIGLPRMPSVVVSVVAALGVVIVLGGVIGTQVAALASDFPRYSYTIEQKVSAVRGFAMREMAAVTKRIGNMSQPAPEAPAADGEGPAAAAPIPVEVHQPPPGPMELAQGCSCRWSRRWRRRLSCS